MYVIQHPQGSNSRLNTVPDKSATPPENDQCFGKLTRPLTMFLRPLIASRREEPHSMSAFAIHLKDHDSFLPRSGFDPCYRRAACRHVSLSGLDLHRSCSLLLVLFPLAIPIYADCTVFRALRTYWLARAFCPQRTTPIACMACMLFRPHRVRRINVMQRLGRQAATERGPGKVWCTRAFASR